MRDGPRGSASIRSVSESESAPPDAPQAGAPRWFLRGAENRFYHARWVRDREIPLELSPSSNLQTGAVERWGRTLEDHPFDLLYQLGFAVTVNCDNRTMSRTSLTRELALLDEV